MYALFAICNALSPTRVDDNISNIVKERYGEQFTKMSRGSVDFTDHIRLVFMIITERKEFPLSKSFSSTPAPSSSPPTPHHMTTPSSSLHTWKNRPSSLLNATSGFSCPKCAHSLQYRHCARSSSSTRHWTPANSPASSTLTRKRWFNS